MNATEFQFKIIKYLNYQFPATAGHIPIAEMLNDFRDICYAQGMTDAAEKIQQRLINYQSDHGIYDHDTGTTEYPKGGDEYVAELEEIKELLLSARDQKRKTE